MIRNQKILGVITARSGSKGLKNKNILKLNSRPLLYWPIKTFMNSKFIDEFILSTDSTEISKQANRYKCKTPFLRPARLSKDNSSSIDVVIHAINFFKEQKITFDYVALLEPTSPLTDSGDLDKAIAKLVTNYKIADSIVGVSKNINYHPDYNIKMKKKSLISFDSKKIKRRQKISNLFFLDGSLYISKIEALLKYKSFYHKKTLGFEMPKWKSFEIDDYTDFLCVSTIMKNKKRL
tara:strand:- start:943 stop:1650 length:708 start_codon:yes stop_codon:yes gene_type:complete